MIADRPSKTRSTCCRSSWAALLSLLALLCCAPVFAQLLDTPGEATPPEEPVDPLTGFDLSNLASNWWQKLYSEEPDTLEAHLNRLQERIAERLENLQDTALEEATVVAGRIGDAIPSLLTRLRSPVSQVEDAVPAQDEYTLSGYLDLLRLKDEVTRDNSLSRAELEQAQRERRRQLTALEQVQSSYADTDRASAKRIVLGLRQVEQRIRLQSQQLYETRLTERLGQGEQRLLNVQDTIKFARDHITANPDEISALETALETYLAEQDKQAKRQNDQQQALLDLLGKDSASSDQRTLARIRLTLTNSEEAITRLDAARTRGQLLWQQLNALNVPIENDERSDEEKAAAEARRQLLIKEVTEIITLWPTMLDSVEDEIRGWQDVAEATILLPTVDLKGQVSKQRTEARTLAQEVISNITTLSRSQTTLQALRDLLADVLTNNTQGEVSWIARLRLWAIKAGNWIESSADRELFPVGESVVTVGGLMKLIIIILVGYVISRLVRYLTTRMGRKRHIARSSALYTFGRILHYLIMTMAIFFGLSAMGLDFSNFAIIAGALSVGIGFGLQSIVNNFVSGLIILFERSLSVGDYVELDEEVRGTVKEINTRSTIINTNDNFDIVVPNSDLITNRLVNWTLREPVARVRVPFGVAYGTDPELVKKAALEAADSVDFTLKHYVGREPDVWMTGFGDSSLDFELLCWLSRNGVRRPNRVRSAYLFALDRKFREHGIEVPFPQRDLNLRSGFAGAHVEIAASDEPADAEDTPPENPT